MEIKVYSMEGCIHCTNLKTLLDKDKIKYTEIDIEINEKIWEDVMLKTEQSYVPTVSYIKKGKEIFLIPTVDFQNIEDAFILIKELKKEN